MTRDEARALINQASAIMGGIHVPCGVPHSLGERCSRDWMEAALIAAHAAGVQEGMERAAKVVESVYRQVAHPWTVREFADTIRAAAKEAKP